MIDGAPYTVTVQTQPTLQTCTVTTGAGNALANVTNIAVACTDKPLAATLTTQLIKNFHYAWNPVAGATRYRLMEDVAGTGTFTQAGADLAATATSLDRIVPLHVVAGAHYRIDACDASTCISSNDLAVTGNLVAGVGYFKESNTEAEDHFGRSVSLSADGNMLAVGAIGEGNCEVIYDHPPGEACDDAGAVYIFVRNGTTWQQQARLKPAYLSAGMWFGSQVALSATGNRLVVSAPFDSSAATGINGDPTDIRPTDPSNPAAIPVGKYSGAVFVFERTGTDWAQTTYVKLPWDNTNRWFGNQLALSSDGNTLVVTSKPDSTGITPASVLVNSGGAWAFQAQLAPAVPGSFAQFGRGLALSSDGNTVVAGATEGAAQSGQSGLGGAFVFTRAGTVWTQQALLRSISGGVSLGTAAALSPDGNTLAVTEGDINGVGAGVVDLYTRDQAVWTPRVSLRAPTANAREFGNSMALSDGGKLLVVCARRESSNAVGIGVGATPDNNSASFSGGAFTYTRAGNTWNQTIFIKPAYPMEDREFGASVALTPDGATLAIGQDYESSGSTGINGDQNFQTGRFLSSGAAFVY